MFCEVNLHPRWIKKIIKKKKIWPTEWPFFLSEVVDKQTFFSWPYVILKECTHFITLYHWNVYTFMKWFNADKMSTLYQIMHFTCFMFRNQMFLQTVSGSCMVQKCTCFNHIQQYTAKLLFQRLLCCTVTAQWLPLSRCSHRYPVPDIVTTGQSLYCTHKVQGIQYHGVQVEIWLPHT